MIRYIIDGHNVINSIPKYVKLLQRDYPLCLRALYQDLLNYVDSRSVRIVLVFDGNPPWDPIEETGRFVVKFSGESQNADTVIIHQAEKWKGRQTVVVSRDRGVRRAVTGFGCQTMLPSEFNQRIEGKQKIKGREPSHREKKPGPLTQSEVQWWKAEMEKARVKKKEKKE